MTVIWFFLYWIIGGVFFACVALLKLIRLRKARFSCLFSLTAALCALAAAWGSTVWIEKTAGDCLTFPIDRVAITVLFSCGGVKLVVSAIVGFILLVVIGFGLLKFSSWKDRTWLTSFAEKLELYSPSEDENYKD